MNAGSTDPQKIDAAAELTEHRDAERDEDLESANFRDALLVDIATAAANRDGQLVKIIDNRLTGHVRRIRRGERADRALARAAADIGRTLVAHTEQMQILNDRIEKVEPVVKDVQLIKWAVYALVAAVAVMLPIAIDAAKLWKVLGI